MKYIIVYDISDDETRNRVRQLIKDYGGTRFQYSSFIVDLDKAKLDELLTRIKNTIGPEKASVIAVPVCRKCLEKIVTIQYPIVEESEDEEII